MRTLDIVTYSNIEVSLTNRPVSHSSHVESQENKKAWFLHDKPRTEFASGQGLPCENKAFYSPETQHGSQVIRVY